LLIRLETVHNNRHRPIAVNGFKVDGCTRGSAVAKEGRDALCQLKSAVQLYEELHLKKLAVDERAILLNSQPAQTVRHCPVGHCPVADVSSLFIVHSYIFNAPRTVLQVARQNLFTVISLS